MSRRSRRSSSEPPTPSLAGRQTLPTGELTTDSGRVELVPDRDDPDAFTLMVNGVPSSFVDLGDPTNVGFEYMEIMCAVIATVPPGPLDVVHLGAAGCGMARALEALRPGSRQIGVDVDGSLLELVRRWFDLPRSPRLRLRAGDARTQLATLPSGSQDVVVRDVFAGDTTPGHLVTAEFTADVLRVLRPGGLYLVNCADRPPLTSARAEVATLRTALTHVTDRAPTHPGQIAVISEPALLKGRRYGNLVLAAVAPSTDAGSARSADLTSSSLARALRSLAVPASLLQDDELARFVGQAPVLHDVGTTPSGRRDGQPG
ncbi:spermidine synthase [Sanguibacter suaedae]|uniref:Fused MFS/spermidine synthase n=1 Tax=Sanguibacter suaedae TaxID=2795737 RepID=A0A934IBQ5_9MICO|nr:fused MFS/spermidine synthase [Sanguibacter suaedae]MBI9115477.1 fused MFS/spermidine synthase [Sanguibacter suaedae]